MGNAKQRVTFKKPVYTCPFCGQEILGDHVFEVKDEGGDVPEPAPHYREQRKGNH